MEITSPKILFENRSDAGRKLSAELAAYTNQKTLVFAIPNGGVPIAIEIAKALNSELDTIVVRKLVLPTVLEGGLGAVADDGTYYLNEDMIEKYDLNREQVEHEAEIVKANVRIRSLKYSGDKLREGLTGKVVILVDDGLASGITMSVAVEALRHRRPKAIIAAVPVASMTGLARAGKVADKVITCAAAKMSKFFLADYYHHWGDISDEATLYALGQWKKRQQGLQ